MATYAAKFAKELLLALARERGGVFAEFLELLCFGIAMDSALPLLRLLPLPFLHDVVLRHGASPRLGRKREKQNPSRKGKGFRFLFYPSF